MAARRDELTLDLLAWEPPSIVAAFPAEQVKAPIMRDKIARAVAVTLAESEIPRLKIAKRMSTWMGEEITVHMLNAYASQAKSEHTISANRLAALCAVTGDLRLLQLILEPMGMVAIERKWLSAIKEAQLIEKEEEIKALRRLHRKGWKS